MYEPPPKTILIIDDDLYDRVLIRRMFSFVNGADFLEVSSQEELQMLLEDAPPLYFIILDYYIPGVLGFELLEKIRAVYSHTPLILCTGASKPTIARSAVQYGADAYMAKILLTPPNAQRVLERARRAAQSRSDILQYRAALTRLRGDLRGSGEE